MISTEFRLGFKTLIWELFIQSHSRVLLKTVTMKSDKVMSKGTKLKTILSLFAMISLWLTITRGSPC